MYTEEPEDPGPVPEAATVDAGAGGASEGRKPRASALRAGALVSSWNEEQAASLTSITGRDIFVTAKIKAARAATRGKRRSSDWHSPSDDSEEEEQEGGGGGAEGSSGEDDAAVLQRQAWQPTAARPRRVAAASGFHPTAAYEAAAEAAEEEQAVKRARRRPSPPSPDAQPPADARAPPQAQTTVTQGRVKRQVRSRALDPEMLDTEVALDAAMADEQALFVQPRAPRPTKAAAAGAAAAAKGTGAPLALPQMPASAAGLQQFLPLANLPLPLMPLAAAAAAGKAGPGFSFGMAAGPDGKPQPVFVLPPGMLPPAALQAAAAAAQAAAAAAARQPSEAQPRATAAAAAPAAGEPAADAVPAAQLPKQEQQPRQQEQEQQPKEEPAERVPSPLPSRPPSRAARPPSRANSRGGAKAAAAPAPTAFPEVDGEDALYGCAKCRYLRGGCNACRAREPCFTRPKLRWRPDHGHHQTGVENAPTFRPTAEEFKDPVSYMTKITPEAAKYGLAHIVPPEGWAPPFALERGTNGLSMESFRFATRKQLTSHLCCRRAPARPAGAAAGGATGGSPAAAAASGRYGGRYASAKQEAEAGEGGGAAEGTGGAQQQQPQRAAGAAHQEGSSDEEDGLPPEFGFVLLDRKHTLRSFSAYADWAKSLHFSQPLPSAVQSEDRGVPEATGPTFRPKVLPNYSGTQPEPSVAQVEAEFWRIVESPDEVVESLYGQDLDSGHHGSGFPLPEWRRSLLEQHLTKAGASTSKLPPYASEEEARYAEHPWNINNMPRSRGSVLRYLPGLGDDELITGVMVPWLYVGSALSAFCWHVEDHALNSVNYHHMGSAKVWYGVPSHATGAMEEAMRDALPHLFEASPSLLYQLVTHMSPWELKRRGVPVYRVVHEAGSFVVTMPNAYHSGFNTGFNVAEAVNFAPPNWLPFGSDVAAKYQATKKPLTFSHDSLVVALCQAAEQLPESALQAAAAKQAGSPAAEQAGSPAAEQAGSAAPEGGAREVAGDVAAGAASQEASTAAAETASGSGGEPGAAGAAAGEEGEAAARLEAATLEAAAAAGVAPVELPQQQLQEEEGAPDRMEEDVQQQQQREQQDGAELLPPLGSAPPRLAPVEGVRLAAGELALRAAVERRRRAAAAAAVGPIAERRMDASAKPGAKDAAGVHVNTADCDCCHCNGDLWMSAVVCRAAPGLAACPEHAGELAKLAGGALDSLVLLYRHTPEELDAMVAATVARVPGAAEAVAAAQRRRAEYEAIRVHAVPKGPMFQMVAPGRPACVLDPLTDSEPEPDPQSEADRAAKAAAAAAAADAAAAAAAEAYLWEDWDDDPDEDEPPEEECCSSSGDEAWPGRSRRRGAGRRRTGAASKAAAGGKRRRAPAGGSRGGKRARAAQPAAAAVAPSAPAAGAAAETPTAPAAAAAEPMDVQQASPQAPPPALAAAVAAEQQQEQLAEELHQALAPYAHASAAPAPLAATAALEAAAEEVLPMVPQEGSVPVPQAVAAGEPEAVAEAAAQLAAAEGEAAEERQRVLAAIAVAAAEAAEAGVDDVQMPDAAHASYAPPDAVPCIPPLEDPPVLAPSVAVPSPAPLAAAVVAAAPQPAGADPEQQQEEAEAFLGELPPAPAPEQVHQQAEAAAAAWEPPPELQQVPPPQQLGGNAELELQAEAAALQQALQGEEGSPAAAAASSADDEAELQAFLPPDNSSDPSIAGPPAEQLELSLHSPLPAPETLPFDVNDLLA